MEEEFKELAAAYMAVAKSRTKRWPNTDKINIKEYPEAVKDLMTAATLEMVANDILNILVRHADDGR